VRRSSTSIMHTADPKAETAYTMYSSLYAPLPSPTPSVRAPESRRRCRQPQCGARRAAYTGRHDMTLVGVERCATHVAGVRASGVRRWDSIGLCSVSRSHRVRAVPRREPPHRCAWRVARR
jgi:hypothetical protein